MYNKAMDRPAVAAIVTLTVFAPAWGCSWPADPTASSDATARTSSETATAPSVAVPSAAASETAVTNLAAGSSSPSAPSVSTAPAGSARPAGGDTPNSPFSSCVVGTWNLEHLSPASSRGFPENTKGGPKFVPRTRRDLEYIAGVIRRLRFCLVVLQEVAAEDTPDGPVSPQLAELAVAIGGDWQHRVAQSGGKQRVAILFDARRVALSAVCETRFPGRKVNGKNLFDRQGLYAHATFLQDGRPRNDLVVLGVHLASGQGNTKNHDQAMHAYAQLLRTERGRSKCIPKNEHDILIAGDFNASRFDRKRERFWNEMESSGWEVLADSADRYPATRLSGVPLKLQTSAIDYVIVTNSDGGLAGEEIRARNATVHSELLDGTNPEDFRRRASDHLPVTVQITVGPDRD